MSRRTRQGNTVRDVIRAAERPLTPAEIHARASKQLPGLGLATTYRHVQSLATEGYLAGVDYPGQPTRYEWAEGRRKIHFGCRSCDKLFAVDEGIGFQEPAPPELPPGFQVKGSEWILYGLCPACSATQK